MKEIVDAATGEIIQVEEENEVATRKLYEVGAIDEKTADLIENYLRAKEEYEMFHYSLQKAMTENSIQKWSNDYFTSYLNKEGMVEKFDSDRAKETKLKDFLSLLLSMDEESLEMSVYDCFKKLSYRKPTLTVRFKK